MEAPLVPRTAPENWTVIHDEGDIIVGSGSRVAFTSRKAFEAAGEDLVVWSREWGWGIRASSEAVQLMSLVPNDYVFVLDEAWSWKFSDECPQMNSAEDGRAVLRKLLQGRMTPTQRDIFYSADTYRFFMDSPPEEQLCYLVHLQNRWELYRRADEWSPNNRSDDEGHLAVKPNEERCWVLTSREASPIRWSRRVFFPTRLPSSTELMVLEEPSSIGVTGDDLSWKPEPVTRTTPAYLSLT